jgi:hypothetical protein
MARKVNIVGHVIIGGTKELSAEIKNRFLAALGEGKTVGVRVNVGGRVLTLPLKVMDKGKGSLGASFSCPDVSFEIVAVDKTVDNVLNDLLPALESSVE